MKKIMSIVLMIGLLLSVQGIAEQAMSASDQTEQKLRDMIPILDSMAVCLKVTEYDAEAVQSADDRPSFNGEDDALVWSQLRALSENWLSKNPEYCEAENETIHVPAEILDGCAAASFQGLVMAPMLSGVVTNGELIYDDVDDAYVMTMNPGKAQYTVIERTAQDGDNMVVNCGVFDPETNERLGGLTARLQPAAEGALYPFSVTEAHAEDPNDFDGLWTNYCDIRCIEETEAAANGFDTLPDPVSRATPTPQPTVAPTTTPRRSRSSSSSSSSSSSAAAYKRLSRGSRGSDVRDLQERLNELGYNCGTPDGVFGAATENAIRLFQNAIDVDENGVASASVQQKLFARSAPEYEKYSILRKGDKGIRVENLQDRLRELGYTGHPANGAYDSRIADAVALFQESAELEADGIANVETQKALFSSDAPECTEYISLEKNDTGIRVEEMQKQLVHLKYLSKVSKKYDSKTVKAVASFKKAHGYSGNGNTADADLIALMFTSSKSASRSRDDDKEEAVEEKVPEKETETKPVKDTEKQETEKPSTEPATPAEPEKPSESESHSTTDIETPGESTPEVESPIESTPEVEQPSEGKEEEPRVEESQKEETPPEEPSEKEESSAPQESRESEPEPERSQEKESSDSKPEESSPSPETEGE